MKMLMLTHHASAPSGSQQLRRLHQQDTAVRRARLWHLAAERAIAWSRRWVWHVSPHVIEVRLWRAPSECMPKTTTMEVSH